MKKLNFFTRSNIYIYIYCIAKLHQNKSEKYLKNKAFTLVELIVVITILAILGTIAFISLQGYTRDARDAKRVSEIGNIVKSLEAKLMTDRMIPVPDEKIEIKVNGATVYYQGIAGKDVLNKLNIGQEAKDPLDGVGYTYTTTNNLRRYQVFGYLEKGKTGYTKGHRLGVIVDPENGNPIHFKKSGVDLKQTSDNFIVYVDNTSSGKIEGNGEEILKNIGKFIVGNYYNTCKQILENNNYIQGIDGKYIIKTKAKTNLEVFCDMTNDGGGWALLTAKAKYGFPNSGRLEIGENSILKNLNIKEVRWNYISPGQKEFPLIYKFFNKQESDLLLFHENNPPGPLWDEWKLSSIHYPTSAEFANAFSVGEKNTSGIDENSFKNTIKDDRRNYIKGRNSPIHDYIYRGTAWFANYKIRNNYLFFPGHPYSSNTWRLGSETFQPSYNRTDGRSISIWIR